MDGYKSVAVVIIMHGKNENSIVGDSFRLGRLDSSLQERNTCK